MWVVDIVTDHFSTWDITLSFTALTGADVLSGNCQHVIIGGPRSLPLEEEAEFLAYMTPSNKGRDMIVREMESHARGIKVYAKDKPVGPFNSVNEKVSVKITELVGLNPKCLDFLIFDTTLVASTTFSRLEFSIIPRQAIKDGSRVIFSMTASSLSSAMDLYLHVKPEANIDKDITTETWLTDFQFIKILGEGYFSTVYQVKLITSGKLYALKVFNDNDGKKGANLIGREVAYKPKGQYTDFFPRIIRPFRYDEHFTIAIPGSVAVVGVGGPIS